MEDLTLGQVLDFCAEHKIRPEIKWHNHSGGPGAYVLIYNYNHAEVFRDRFGAKWLSIDEVNEARDEDTYRAGRY